MDIIVSDFTDVTSFQLFLFWDETVLEVAEVVDLHPSLVGFVAILPEQDAAQPRTDKLRLNWFDGVNFQTLDDGNSLATVRFNIVGEQCDVSGFSIRDLGDQPAEKIEVLTIANDGVTYINLDLEYQATNFQIPGQGCASPTSTEELAVATVRIYPNPVRDNLQVSFKNHTPKESSLIIYDEDGRLLSQNPLTNVESNIDISDINNGIYFYEIHDKGIVVDQGRIMKI